MRVFESLVAGLENIGVTAAFGGAGETCTGMMLALKHSTQIRGIITRHEQAASFMACGYAMYTNHLGVCWATAGPGAFNLFSGLGMAMSDSYPILAITGYANRHWMGRGSLNETSSLNNTPDSQKMFAACTKGSWIIDHPDQTCDILELAVNTAFAGRPGPVHIAVPGEFNLPGHDVTNHRRIQRSVESLSPDPARVDEIAVMLANAFAKGKSVVALVGFGAIRSGANSAVKEFIERFQIPLLTTLDGKGIVSENHPLSVGVFCDSGHASAWKAFMNADVVVAIGNAFNQHATFNYWEGLFDGRTLVHINISESEIDKVHKADYALVADAQLAVRAMTEALDAKTGARTPAVVDGRDYESRVITPLPGAIHPARLAQIVGRLLPERGIVLADAGAHLTWLGYYLELESGQHFRKAGEFGPMAGYTNGAIGLQVAHPDRTIVVGCGDGCYSLSGFELMTAVEHELPVIWIIFNDGEFKLIKIYQMTEFFESGLVDFRNPDFAAYARACGANGYSVSDEDEFEVAFKDALASGKPCVIDAKITRWAIPHFSTSPRGTIAGIVERIEERMRGA
ncbi:MAG: glyoxylate carboligase [Verrucomicrobia bacterium]|nr:MAG: glyoxylate carboligase [Verrucomicrobiota bacterium]